MSFALIHCCQLSETDQSSILKPASVHCCLNCLKLHYVLFFPKTNAQEGEETAAKPGTDPKAVVSSCGGRTSAAAATARLPPTSPRPKGQGFIRGGCVFGLFLHYRTARSQPQPGGSSRARPLSARQQRNGAGGCVPPGPALPCPAQPGPAQPGGHLPSADGAISMRVSLAFLPRRFMAPRLPHAPPGPCSPAPGRLAASRSAAVRWGTG